MRANNLQLQDRDLALLRGLFECRVMTADHAAKLYFDGKGEAAKKRLQKIKSAGLISERPRLPFEPSILFLTRKGLQTLQAKGLLAQYPSFALPVLERRARVSDLTIRHELEVMDVKTAFHSAIKSEVDFTIDEFITWPLLSEFKAHRPGPNGPKVDVRPDGFIRFIETDGNEKFERIFFLEVDRSSEVRGVLTDKACCYYDYYKSGSFAVRNGADRSKFKEFPFRVLMVFKSAERRNNIAERLLQNNPPILTQVCLSTLEEVIANPLGAIWFRPVDYREAVKETPFDAENRREQRGYIRQSARDEMIEQKVRKSRILAKDSSVIL